MNRNNITLTIGQIVAGSVLGLVGGWLCLVIFDTFILQFLLGDRIRHGFWVGLFLLIALSVSYGIVIVGSSVGIRLVSERLGRHIPLKPLCSGAFLGPPAVVGLLSLLNVPWEIFGPPNLLLMVLLPVLKTLAYIISLPMRGWVSLGLPVEIWYILAIPIGAILGYRLTWRESSEAGAEQV